MRVHYLTDISASGGKAYRSSGRYEGRDDDLRPEVDDRTNSDLHREAAGTLTGEKERRQGQARPATSSPPTGRAWLARAKARSILVFSSRRHDLGPPTAESAAQRWTPPANVGLVLLGRPNVGYCCWRGLLLFCCYC